MPLVHNGWSAWISIDGEELPQYAVKVEKRPGTSPGIPIIYTVSGWIPSRCGKGFSIHLRHDDSIFKRPEAMKLLQKKLDGLNKRKGAASEKRTERKKPKIEDVKPKIESLDLGHLSIATKK